MEHLILPYLVGAVVCWLIVFVLDKHKHHFLWMMHPSGDMIETCTLCGTGRTLITKRQLEQKEAHNG